MGTRFRFHLWTTVTNKDSNHKDGTRRVPHAAPHTAEHVLQGTPPGMDGVESALGGGKFQRTPHGPPDRLARDPIPQCLMHGAMVEVRQHVHPRPAVRITGPQMPLQPLPQLCLTHAATVPASTSRQNLSEVGGTMAG